MTSPIPTTSQPGSQTPLASPDSPPVPGLVEPVFQAQRLFRGLMDAMARPGSIVDLGKDAPGAGPLEPAEAAILLTLADADTQVWLSHPTTAADRYLAFHTGCPRVQDAADADFALLSDPRHALPFDQFRQGLETYPERAATVILRLPSLTEGSAFRAEGPGIAGSRMIAPSGLPDGFATAWAENRDAYPCGVDLFLTTGSRVLGLPRTTRLTPAD